MYRQTYENDEWKAHSVWDDYFDVHGTALHDVKLKGRNREVATSETQEVATSNKMRGPLSDQPKKIGEPILGVVDHIYFSHRETDSGDPGDKHFELKRHVFTPLVYDTSKARRVCSNARPMLC